MNEQLKGFIFGACMMMLSPAFATQSEPQTAASQPAAEAPAQLFRLTYRDAEEAISQALAERGAGSKLRSQITNTTTDDFIFSYSQPISVEIRGLRFEKDTHRFNANLVSLSGKNVISARAISGRFDEMIEVPVLKRTVRAGDIISKDDIEIRDYAEARSRPDMITDMAALIGKSPQRVISANRPIRQQEIAKPALVKKDELVKMTFQHGGMSITTTGEALDDAALGGNISVRNLASKRVVQGTVTGEGTVAIDGPELSAGKLASTQPSVRDIYEN